LFFVSIIILLVNKDYYLNYLQIEISSSVNSIRIRFWWWLVAYGVVLVKTYGQSNILLSCDD